MRKPHEILHKGVRLSDALEAHRLWLVGKPNVQKLVWDGASLSYASLNYASLDGASLNRAWLNRASLDGASLDGTRGNMREVKSAQFDHWPVTWTRAPGGATTLQIGCQKHDLELWRRSDPRWIAALAGRATEWWAQYRDVVLALVDASPAVQWGKPDA